MTYLGIEQGAFVTARVPEGQPLEFFTDRCEQVGMKFVVIEDHAAAASIFQDAGFGAADAQLHAFWRYSMWVERNLIRGLRLYAAELGCSKSAPSACEPWSAKLVWPPATFREFFAGLTARRRAGNSRDVWRKS
jgi:hypothetical protein